jgi:hypothetical protein
MAYTNQGACEYCASYILVEIHIYQEAEMKIFEVVKAWMNALRDTDMLMDQFKTTEIPEQAKMKVEYNRPEAIVSPNEKLDLYDRKIEMGIISRIDIIMETEGLDKEDAIQRAMEIDRENSMQGMIIDRPDLNIDINNVEEANE